MQHQLLLCVMLIGAGTAQAQLCRWMDMWCPPAVREPSGCCHGPEPRARPPRAIGRHCADGTVPACSPSSPQSCLRAAECTEQDDAALPLYERACTGGDAIGCFTAGWIAQRHARSMGDLRRAARLYERGCARGSQGACANFGALLIGGFGVAADPARGLELARHACDANIAQACYLAGHTIEYGAEGIAYDARQALPYFDRACTLGDQYGCNNAINTRRNLDRREP